ncbi:hypothetical protein Dda_1308 [Drechslerella dactyloides]|uniref:Uncharacterized protein n=1 Tax=Drechslerella dactyloides TaxID=74499 RepID=A0AAD6NKH2_DREDA|nr:hypothetical protein Dda_1308 [Drechslerella dactyloides]
MSQRQHATTEHCAGSVLLMTSVPALTIGRQQHGLRMDGYSLACCAPCPAIIQARSKVLDPDVQNSCLLRSRMGPYENPMVQQNRSSGLYFATPVPAIQPEPRESSGHVPVHSHPGASLAMQGLLGRQVTTIRRTAI